VILPQAVRFYDVYTPSTISTPDEANNGNVVFVPTTKQSSVTAGILLPRLTTAARDAMQPVQTGGGNAVAQRGLVAYNSDQNRLNVYDGATWHAASVDTIGNATTSGAAIVGTATETLIFPNIAIPAGFLADGRSIRLTVRGEYSALANQTLTFEARLNSVTGTPLCKSGALKTVSVSHALFEIEVVLTVRSNGATGTVMANGRAILHSATTPTVGSATGAPAIGPMTAGGQTAPSVVTADVAGATGLAITAKWSAASASNTLTGLNYVVEAMN
jgi:hypothetical protein